MESSACNSCDTSPTNTGVLKSTLPFKNPAMQQLVQQVEVLATSDTPILLLGETGTGKNFLAGHIHRLSGRPNGTCLRLNCRELSCTLLESELFGHVKGAFTGATELKVGYLDMVCGGTLFLDEIGDLDLGMQSKLLNVLDTKQFRRVGGREDIITEFRLISATNVDIQSRVEAGSFRKDFYYRIQGEVIRIPPLRERREDIWFLADFFLQNLSKHYNKKPDISKEALICLTNYSWPGNIRELRLALMIAAGHAKGGRIEREHLPMEVQQGALLATALNQQRTGDKFLDDYVRQVLKLTHGNKTHAAKFLGWSLNRLYRWLKTHGMK